MDLILAGDYGGRLFEYFDRVSNALHDGVFVKILGPCVSACTMFLMVPADHICVGKYGVLGFHEASTRNGTYMLVGSYPPPIWKWIQDRGGLTGRVLYLKGPELRKYFQECK